MSLSRAVCVCWLISVASPAATLPSYYLVKQSLTWLEAVSYCRSQYTDLVSTLSDLEVGAVFVTAFMSEVWIGRYLCAPGDWRWSNGANGTYTKWNSGEPSLSVSACVRLSSGKWISTDCGAQHYAVCYKLSGSTAPDFPSDCLWPLRTTTAQTVTTQSPEVVGYWNSSDPQVGMGHGNGPGGNSSGPGQSSSPSSGPGQSSSPGPTTDSALGVTTSGGYVGSTTTRTVTGQSGGAVVGKLHLVPTPMTWAESRTFCRSNYTDLATISSDEEQTMVSTLLSSHIPSQGFWFGLKRNRFWGNWYWSGGRTLGAYNFWGESEPSHPFSQLCGFISGDPSGNFSWSSGCCGESLPFVCYM